MQLLWAREQRADVVAPYLGRLQAEGRDIESLIRACIALQEDGVKLLAASVKTADLLSRLIALGAHAVTLQPAFAASLATDPVTDAAIRAFAADITATARSDNRA
jgi:transaldolase/fructose-6-phosphate aldolase 1